MEEDVSSGRGSCDLGEEWDVVFVQEITCYFHISWVSIPVLVRVMMQRIGKTGRMERYMWILYFYEEFIISTMFLSFVSCVERFTSKET